MRVALICGVGLLLSCSRLTSAQTDADARAADMSQALIRAHVAWKTRFSTPGTSVKVKEVARHGSLVQYHLYVSGLPTDELYEALSWPVGTGKPVVVMKGLSLGKDGIVMCAGRKPEQCGTPSRKDDPVEFTFSPAKGEPYRLGLVAGNNRVTLSIVPDPIEGKDKGCALNAERLTPRFELAYFTGSGFPANTDVSFDSQSFDEKHPVNTKTDDEGNLQFALMPFVTGHKKGTTTVRTVGAVCSPSLKFDWGN